LNLPRRALADAGVGFANGILGAITRSGGAMAQRDQRGLMTVRAAVF